MAHSLTVQLNGATEVELMQLIWSHHYTTSAVLTRSIQRSRHISINTVNTTLTQLVAKGLLRCDRAPLIYRKHGYAAVWSKLEYLAQAINTVLSAFAATPAERVYIITALETPRRVAHACQPILGTTELQIMQMIWSEGYRFGRQIVPFFQGRYAYPIQTVNIILVGLARKGLLTQERPTLGKRPYAYTPVLTKADYLIQEVERIVTTVDATPAERHYLVAALQAARSLTAPTPLTHAAPYEAGLPIRTAS